MTRTTFEVRRKKFGVWSLKFEGRVKKYEGRSWEMSRLHLQSAYTTGTDPVKLRNRMTIEYLGLWESLYNPEFKPLEFEGFRNEVGLNAFTMSSSKSGRNVFFDVVKAFAIGLVVLGHALSINGIATADFIGNFIVGMNMPLFFILSGYFSYSTLKNADLPRFRRHIKSYLWPMAVVSCLFAALAIPFGLTTVVKAPIYAVKYFLFPLWYVWALCIMYAMSFVSCCFFAKLRYRLLMMGMLYLGLFFLPRGTWYVTNVRAMFPFFVIGAFLLRSLPLWKNAWIGCASLIVYIALCVGEGNINTNGLSFYSMSTHWQTLVVGGVPIFLFAARLAIGFVGSIGMLWAIDGMSEKFPRAATCVSVFGTTTLGVYLLHQWIFYRLSSFVHLSAFWSVCEALMVWLVCHLLTVKSKRNRRMSALVWGVDGWS